MSFFVLSDYQRVLSAKDPSALSNSKEASMSDSSTVELPDNSVYKIPASWLCIAMQLALRNSLFQTTPNSLQPLCRLKVLSDYRIVLSARDLLAGCV